MIDEVRALRERIQRRLKTLYWEIRLLREEQKLRRMYLRVVFRVRKDRCWHPVYSEELLEMGYWLFSCHICGYQEINRTKVVPSI